MRVCSVCQRCYDDLEFSCVIESHPTPAEFRSGYPEMIPGFKLDRVLKAENGEQTYEALHLESGHPCLVHIYRGSEQLAEKFLGDADAVKALFHPNIADVYEAGLLDDGGYFVVSELAEGQTFSKLLRTRGVPELLDAITLVRQAAEAVHAIHLKGLFHRAINSDNIFITHDVDGRQTVKLVGIDLGGVAQNSMVADKFSIDSAVDRLRYFAPELFGGEAASLKTDIYALGVVFYEMLAGHTPFTAATASGLVEMHRNSPPADIRIDDFELRMLITHTLTESLMKRPEKRQTSANAFARQLRHIEQLSTHVSTPPPAIKVAELPHISPARVELNIADKVIPVSPVDHEKEVAVPLVIDESISEPPVVAESIQKPLTKRVRRKKRHSPVVVPVVEHEVQQIAPVMLERSKSVAAAAAAAAVTLSRKKVELPQLDDDIPTMADVLEELSKEPVSPASLELPREVAPAPAPIVTQSEVNDPKIETREPQTPAEANDLP